MSEQDGRKASNIQRPKTDDAEAWKAYWKTQNQPWRTEPEIDGKRQKYLDQRRSIKPDWEQGVFPFKDIKLSRSDVEWLLATHENGRGPVYWWDESQREREGLDLRGADLRQVNLSRVPLARISGGLDWEIWQRASKEQRDMAAVHLEGACLDKTHLEGADLASAYLEKAHLYLAHLEEAALDGANFEGATFVEAHLEEAYLTEAHLEDTSFQGVYLDGTRLYRINLCNKDHIGPWVENTHWSDANLSVVNWSQMKMVREEYETRKCTDAERARLYEIAAKTNRQLAVALQAQGLNEDAARFAYRGQKLQRVVLRQQRKYLQYVFSFLLDLLAGYGYRPGRSVIWYLVVIFGFAMAYFIFGHLPLFPDTIVFSLTSFHGRGFFPGLGNETSLHNPLVILAACEAVIGLLIEISFIATFTQRFFSK